MNTFFSHEQKHWTMKIFLEKMACYLTGHMVLFSQNTIYEMCLDLLGMT